MSREHIGPMERHPGHPENDPADQKMSERMPRMLPGVTGR